MKTIQLKKISEIEAIEIFDAIALNINIGIIFSDGSIKLEDHLYCKE